jgi:solute carrier family 25 (adenine nucleotide translocator) protein 4/5/6/31
MLPIIAAAPLASTVTRVIVGRAFYVPSLRRESARRAPKTTQSEPPIAFRHLTRSFFRFHYYFRSPSHYHYFIIKSQMSSSSEFIINFLAGGVSGAVAKTATAPIERVKLLIQTQDANPKIISGEVARYNGIVDCFSRVASEQGVKAFWRGNLTNIIRYFPTQAFNFAFKDTIKAIFPKADKSKEFGKFFAINMASGGLAGAGSLLIVYPLDYARTRLASDVGSGKAQFSGLFDCLKQTIKTGGLAALYNGIGVSIVGIIPYRGVYFGLFDTMSGYNPYQKSDNNVLRAGSKFVCAQSSAIAAGYASYPFDTVRRRLQMQSEKPKAEWVYSGTMDCFGKIVANEGAGALFKGAGANALRTVGAAMVLVLYSEITAFFNAK